MKKAMLLTGALALSLATFVGCQSDEMNEPAGAERKSMELQSETSRSESPDSRQTDQEQTSPSLGTNDTSNGSTNQP